MFSHRVINRIFLSLCAVFAVMLAAMIYIARERTELIINQLSVDRVRASKQGLDNYIDSLSERAMQRGAVLAKQERLVNAIKEYNDNGHVLTDENYQYLLELSNEFLSGFDFISITDQNGTALARVDTGEREYPLPPNGYSLLSNPDVRQVFETGEEVSALTFMLDNTTLVATTLYPIYDGDELIGIVTCLYDLTNPRYLNEYKKQSGTEVAIFLGHDVFISTFNYGANPVGLVAGEPVIRAIFENEEESFISFDDINGVTYGTIFTPLVYRGDIIGMKFTGVDVQSAMGIRTEMDTLIEFIAVSGIVIVLIFILVVQRYNRMVNRQITQQTLMTNISQSFLTDEDIDVLISNTFREIGTLMNVSQILMYKAHSADPSKLICSNEWQNPSLELPSHIGDELTVSVSMFETYAKLNGNEKFYISSDDRHLEQVMAPYRKSFKNFLTSGIFIDEHIYAIVDFSRASRRGKWSKDDINTASFVSNILTMAFHRKMVEDQLVSAKELAEQNSKYKSVFLANVSHEIRTPMNAILGITEIYLQDRVSRANIDEGLSMIYDSANLLLGIINDILDLSKIEAGKMEITPVKYDIPSLINETVLLCRMRFGSKPIEFDLDIDKHTPLNLFGDELRIRQVLNNILSNAFKYTERGRIRMSVSANPIETSGAASEQEFDRERIPALYEPGKDGIMLIFSVTDTGQGMTDEQLDALFDEFTRFSLDLNRTIVGTGLGMSITKQLLDLMHGEIFVESTPGEGSTFTVHIPQTRLDDNTCGPDMAERLNSFRYHSSSLSKKAQIVYEYMPYGSVLVVDDVESNLYVAKGMLIPYGLKIDTATSGFEAIDHITGGKKYDVIFMDHMMPKMDGIETVKNLREMGYEGTIIALTANALVGQAEIFLENGFDAYIPKPIDTRELNSALVAYIRNKKPPEVVNAAREEAREAELLRTLEAAENNESKPDTANSEPDMTEVISFFLSDAANAIDVIEEEYNKLCDGKDFNTNRYRISVHGMKSAARNIGEKYLSDFAYELEQAALANNIEKITADTSAFLDTLKAAVLRLEK